ncbi:OmpA family protein [Pelagibius sp. Alg239-R121]|uniref:OmpA family protein n=1 Tax=Pelagibius sp. Alg239-R121 TaxID=2993448 RepID=UPI0024A70280|nr:OmpA family protein [Pelagibius sp. Alg239-R121]
MTRQTYRTGSVTTPSSVKTGGALSGSKLPLAADRRRFASGIACFGLATLLSSASVTALAESSVFVNEALLDGITQQGVPVLPYGGQGAYQGQPGYNVGGSATTIVGTNADGSQYYVTRPSTLLFPPPQFPRSRVTIIDSSTASGGGNALSSNRLLPRGTTGGVATQTTSSAVAPTTAGTSGGKAESRLLVPLPPNISQQAAKPKAPAAKPAKRKVAKAAAVPQPPKNSAPTAKASVPKAPAPKAPAPKTPATAKAVPAAPAAPKIAAAPPPPKLVPKALAETSPPKTASLGNSSSATSAGNASQLKDTNTALTPPPPPPPVTPSSGAQAAQPKQQAAAPKAAVDDSSKASASSQSASRGNTGAKVSEVQVLFGSNEAALSGQAKSSLESVAEAMLADEASEVQLFAYAGQADIDATQARRLSLSRAMAVRAYLIGKGVRPARMQVRALGNKTTSGSPDRVDVVPAKR